METLERAPRLRRQYDFHNIQRDEIIARRDLPEIIFVACIEWYLCYQFYMHIVGPAITTMRIILVLLSVILSHCPVSGTQRRPATDLYGIFWICKRLINMKRAELTIQIFVATTNDLYSHFSPGSNLHRMSATNLAREAWTESTIQSIAATTYDVCSHFNPRSNLHRMSATNLARVECSERTIQNNAATIGIFPVYNRWNILQRINGTNLAHVAWNEYTIQNIVATTHIASPLILPDSLNQFLDLSQRRQSYSMVQIMSYEMMRLHSFKREFAVSAIRLTQSGFFATGVVDEVKCFSCGVYYRNWQSADIPHLLHERLSPNCRMVLGSEANNRPIQKLQSTLQSGILCTEYSADDLSHEIKRYKMDAMHRGIAVIINNEIFTNNSSMALGNRPGTHIDAEKLKTLWRNLRFIVDFHENKTAEEMCHIAVNTARINHREYDCLVFCILTHGGDCGILYGTDGRSLHIHKITELFHSIQCPNLAGKPKLFFIQACQGILNQTGLVVFRDGNYNPAEIPANSNSQNRLAETIPNDADFLISYATVPGYVSFRCPTNGAWYIRSLFTNLTKYAQRYDLMTILSYVSSDVGEDETTEGDITYKQTPIHMTTLRKQVYFS